METSPEKILQKIKNFSHPQNLKKEFVVSQYTYEAVYQLAAGIRKQFAPPSDKRHVICLTTEDKGLIIGAVLASLVSDLILVLPYAYSKQVLKELQEETGFTKAIGENIENLPSGVDIISPEPCQDYFSLLESLKAVNDPDKVFLELFTGGSTGKSKIWQKTYRNLLGESFYLSEKFDISDRDMIMATVPPYHIYGLLFSVLLPFVSSASVMPETYVFPKEIISVIKKALPTVLISIPIHYKALNQSGMDKDSGLKVVFSSASPLNKTESMEFYRQTGIGITEIYGSTETGGIATRCQAFGEASFNVFDNIDWKIQDEHLCIRSDFISPSLKKDADGFFTTGDRVSYHHKDSFILAGRSDDIVKIGGKRVDLKEIQHKLMQLSGIRNVIVSSVPGDKGRENEIFAVLEGDTDESRVRAFASEKLEPYAIPRRIRIVDKIPVSSTGKYSVQILKEMVGSGKL